MDQPLKDLLVVCDIDNTLVTDRMELPACNLETVRLFCALGGRFTLATGRTPGSAKRAAQGVPVNAPAICCGGGLICDLNSGEVLERETLDRRQANWLLTDVLRRFPDVGAEVMCGDGEICVVNASPYTEKHIRDENLAVVYCPQEELPDGWLKVTFADEPEMLNKIARFLESREYPGLQTVRANRIYFEIMPEKVNKGAALRKICQKIKIPLANSVAIGDYYNDIDLLKAAGRAVAMGDSPREVKLAADCETGSCQDGGVASFLYQLIKEYT